MESLSNELRALGDSSTSVISKAVYQCTTVTNNPGSGGSTRRSSIRGVSVATQFKLSLQSLVDDLEQTQPHYIRCIKPNSKKAPNALAAGEVLKQLRYSGMMEAIRIRREGYALREDHSSFYNRFSVLLTEEDVQGDGGIENLVKILSQRLNVSDAGTWHQIVLTFHRKNIEYQFLISFRFGNYQIGKSVTPKYSCVVSCRKSLRDLQN